MAGFKFAYRLGGGAPTTQTFKFKDTETLSFGDLLNLEGSAAARRVDLGATGDTNFVGVVQSATQAGTADTTTLEAVTDDDAVYSVVDNNARNNGDTLDIAGATGAQGVAASSNKEFVVVADSTATQPTLVKFNTGKHYKNKAQ